MPGNLGTVYKKQERLYKPGEIIFAEKDPCDGLYIINSGLVRIFKKMEKDGKVFEVELVRLGPMSLFGEMGMIDEQVRSASVQAVDATICTIITKRMFEDQLGKIPGWTVKLITVLVRRLRETNEKLMGKVVSQIPETGGIIAWDGSHQDVQEEVNQVLQETQHLRTR